MTPAERAFALQQIDDELGNVIKGLAVVDTKQAIAQVVALVRALIPVVADIGGGTVVR